MEIAPVICSPRQANSGTVFRADPLAISTVCE
jgi:hypothetical protein